MELSGSSVAGLENVCYIYVATVSCWYGSTLQPLLKVRYVGGVTVSRLQPMLTQIYDF